MCGIFGARNFDTRQLNDIDTLIGATQTLRHRGPDDGAYWHNQDTFLGHRRLSIIDLEGNNQPMKSCDGRFVMTFNGEIYNFRELSKTLATFGIEAGSKSDSEVIIEGYRLWGTDVVSKLRGMFAFALFDQQTGELILARDRFGEKPLFFSETDDGIVFASEISGIVYSLSNVPEIALDVMASYLSLNYVPGERSLLKGIERVAPGTVVVYAANGNRYDEVYWTPTVDTDYAQLGQRDASSAFRGLFDSSVSLALTSDVPVTLFLSGGVDSSLIAESAVRQGGVKVAYCLGFDDPRFDETPQAEVVAKKLGLELRRVTAKPLSIDDFEDLINHVNDPLGDSSAVALWPLAREASADFRVALGGDGGDELFGGYLTYGASELHHKIVSRTSMQIRSAGASLSRFMPASDGKVTFGQKLMRFLRAAPMSTFEAHLSWNGAWIPSTVAQLLLPKVASGAGAEKALARVVAYRSWALPDNATFRGKLQCLDVQEYLANDILVKTDRVTMAHGLEVRAPFLDPDLAQFGISIKDQHKFSKGRLKCILRDQTAEIFGSELAYAKKQGFSIPIHRWLRESMREVTETILSPQNISELGVFDVDRVMHEKERHMSGATQSGFELWGLIVLVAWHRSIKSLASRRGRLDGISMRRVF